MAITETLTLKVDAKVKQAVIDGLKKIGTEGKKGQTEADRLGKNINKLNPAGLNRLATAANKANGGLLNMVKSATLMGYNLQGIVLLGVNKLRSSFVDMTDQFNRVIGQMELMTGSFDEAVRLTRKLQEAAVDTGWSLDDLSTGTTKMITGMGHYGLTADRAIEATRNLGLWMRAMGDTGARIPKLMGGLALMFQRTTLTAEKLEMQLGRGRSEQFLRGFGEELVKYKNIDITSATNKNLSALQLMDKLVKENNLSHKELNQVVLNTIDRLASNSVIATEIGHGWDKLSEAVKLFITQLDFAAGGSNALAGIFSHLAHGIKGIAKHMNSVVGVLSAMAGGLAALALVAVPGKLVLIGVQLIALVKHLGFVKGAIKAITLALAKNPFTFFFVAATTTLIIFRDEVDKLAQRLVRWVEGLKDTLGILYGPIKWIVDGIAAIAKSIGLIGTEVTTGGGRAGQTGGTPDTDTTPAGGGPAPVSQVKGQADALIKRQQNLLASDAAGLETDKAYIQQVAGINAEYQKLLRTQAFDLKAKPMLRREIELNIKATQWATDELKKAKQAEEDRAKFMNLGSVKALEGFDNQIKNLNIALQNGDITADQYRQKAVALNTAVKGLNVSHASELDTYKDLKARVDQLTESTEGYVKSLEEEQKQKQKAQQAQQAFMGAASQLGHAAIDTVGKEVGGSAGGLLSATAGGGLTGGLAGGPVGAVIGAITAGVVHIVTQTTNLDGDHKEVGRATRKAVRDQIFEFQEQFREISKLEKDQVITAQEATSRRAGLHQQLREFQAVNEGVIRELDARGGNISRDEDLGWTERIGRGGAPRPPAGAPRTTISGLLDNLITVAGTSATKVTEQQMVQQRQLDTQEQQRMLMQQQVDLQKQLVEDSKRQLEVMTRERDAAILEARLQAQAAQATIATGVTRTRTTTGERERPEIQVNMNFSGDIGKAVKGELKSDTTGQAILNTMYQNADEYGEFAGGQSA